MSVEGWIARRRKELREAVCDAFGFLAGRPVIVGVPDLVDAGCGHERVLPCLFPRSPVGIFEIFLGQLTSALGRGLHAVASSCMKLFVMPLDSWPTGQLLLVFPLWLTRATGMHWAIFWPFHAVSAPSPRWGASKFFWDIVHRSGEQPPRGLGSSQRSGARVIRSPFWVQLVAFQHGERCA